MDFFERCCDYIYNSLEVSVALLIGAGVVAIAIYLYNHRVYEEAESEKDGVCQSPSCIRCTSDGSFEQLTKKKMTEYLRDCPSSDALSNLTEDILGHGDRQPADTALQNPTVLWLANIRPTVWFDSDSTHAKDVKILENNFSIILEEYRSLLHEPGWIVNQKENGCWKIYHLMSQGIFTVNATKCPQTVDVLKSLKGLMIGTVFGYASFSVLQPGTAVVPHFGATNSRIRCHLGLQVDPVTCYVVVANERRSWKNGKCLLFDDSFLHSAHHEGVPEDESRVVLMVDLWHSDLSEEEIRCIHSVYSSDLIFECTSFTNTD